MSQNQFVVFVGCECTLYLRGFLLSHMKILEERKKSSKYNQVNSLSLSA